MSCTTQNGNPSAGENHVDSHTTTKVATNTPPQQQLASTEIGVSGMTCSMCTRAVDQALRNVDGVVSVAVSLATHSAHIEYDKSKVDRDELVDTIECIGYDVVDLEATQSPSSSSPPSALSIVEFSVSGMTCSMCSQAIERALNAVDGTSQVSVSLATNIARVEYDPSVIASEDELKELIEDIGYDVVDTTLVFDATKSSSLSVVEFSVSGMTCSMCSQAIERALNAVDGTTQVSVSLATNIARVEYDSSIITSEDELKEIIEDIGYDVVDTTVVNNTTEQIKEGAVSPDRLERMLQQQQTEVDTRKRAFLVSLLWTIPIFMVTMVLPWVAPRRWMDFLHQTVRIGHSGEYCLEALILWALCTPIQFGCGWAFYKSSWFGFRQGVLGMDVLVAVGTTSSYGCATWATLAGSMEYHFFETSAVLICFVLLGKWMQSLAVRRTSQALTQLLELQPKTAIQVVTSGSDINDKDWDPRTDSYGERQVPLASIHTGDIVKVLKGASVPADGVVMFGEMSVDESMITGESIPVLKTKGSIVLGGTICAESGREAAFVQVTGVGSSTALSQIVQLVQNAQNRQVPIQNLADQISGIFVPTVVTISIMTYIVWYALCQSETVPASWVPQDESPATFSLLFGIACLVISCPCALGLATPTAVMVGTGVGAKQGVLMKGGETLELASQVNSIVFDKTGTLTKGKPAITDFELMLPDRQFWTKVVPDHNSDEVKGTANYLLWLFGSVERNSEHPLAGAIVMYAEQKLQGTMEFSPPSDFTALTGRGAAGTIQGNIRVAVGNRAFCEIQGLQISDQVEAVMQRLERQGKTAIVAAVNSTICVVMGIADELKSDAGAAISYLKDEMGIDVWMVTGDNRRTARAIARQLNLPADRVIAEALPAAKVEQVEKLQGEGRIVAMVGDGVNDSPALAQANVGLGLGAGAEIAAEAADMVLVRGNVSDVCTALHLSRVIFRRIQLNLLLSLVYNSLTIPLAAGAFYPFIRTRVPPTLAALAMALSSTSVVCSSLALRLYKPPVISANGREKLTFSAGFRRKVAHDTEQQQPLLDCEMTELTSDLSEMETDDEEKPSSSARSIRRIVDGDQQKQPLLNVVVTEDESDLSEMEEGRGLGDPVLNGDI